MKYYLPITTNLYTNENVVLKVNNVHLYICIHISRMKFHKIMNYKGIFKYWTPELLMHCISLNGIPHINGYIEN